MLSSTIHLTGLRLPALTSILPCIPSSTHTQWITLLSSKFFCFYSRTKLSFLCASIFTERQGPSAGPQVHFQVLYFCTTCSASGAQAGLYSRNSPPGECRGLKQLLIFPELLPPSNICSLLFIHCPSVNSPFQL